MFPIIVFTVSSTELQLCDANTVCLFISVKQFLLQYLLIIIVADVDCFPVLTTIPDVA